MEKRERGETNRGRKRRETGDERRLKRKKKTEPRKRGGCGIAARGTARTFGESLGRSTVAHFARKVRGANIMATKHGMKI